MDIIRKTNVYNPKRCWWCWRNKENDGKYEKQSSIRNSRIKSKIIWRLPKQEITSLENKEKTSTGLPKSNVLYFDLEKNAWVCVRPSGTEPKIKFYMGVCEKTMADAEKKLTELENAVKEMAEEAKK